ncbi:MAG TPA: hypothetical protein VF881_07370 [Polyangiaceae bacterium]
MRSWRVVLAACFIGASACSLFLDTDSLQAKEGSSGSSGTAGSSGSDAGNDAAVKTCETDLDCIPFTTDVDGCLFYGCSADKTCLPPQPHPGFAIASVGGEETVLQSDDIGYPSLVADTSDIVMGVWERNGTATDVLVRKYPPYPASPASVTLSALVGGLVEAYGSSPGMIIRSTVPRSVRLLLALDPFGAASMGMHQIDLDIPALNSTLKLTSPQPTKGDLEIAGYDTSPRASAPRMMPNGFQEPSGMWAQQEQLYYFDGTIANVAFGAKRVLGFTVLAGYGVHAALETAELGDAGATMSKTEVWSMGSASLASLNGDELGARRSGVTATSTAEGLTTNFISWSFESATTGPQLKFSAASCFGNSCTAIGADSPPIPGVAPQLASARVMGSNIDRDMVQTFAAAILVDRDLGTTTYGFLGGVSRLTLPDAEFAHVVTKTMNPALFLIDSTTVPSTVAAGELFGPSSVAITNDGQILVAWVTRPMLNRAVLKTRRYQVKMCP